MMGMIDAVPGMAGTNDLWVQMLSASAVRQAHGMAGLGRLATVAERHQVSALARSSNPADKAQAQQMLSYLDAWGDGTGIFGRSPLIFTASDWDAYGDVVQNVAGLSAAERSAAVGMAQEAGKAAYSLTAPGLVEAAARGEVPYAFRQAGEYYAGTSVGRAVGGGLRAAEKAFCEALPGKHWDEASASCEGEVGISTGWKVAGGVLLGTMALVAARPYVAPLLRRL